MTERSKTIAVPLITVCLGLGIGAAIVALSGGSIAEVYAALFRGVLSSPQRWAAILKDATPLLLTGLAAALSFRGGMLNIGAEGQLYWGAMAAAWVGATWTFLPGFIHPYAAIAAGFGAGAVWAWGPGLLRLRWGVNDFITTIMFSDMAILLTSYVVNFVYRNVDAEHPETPPIAVAAELPQLLPGVNINLAIVVAVLLAAGSAYLLWYTVAGYEMRMTGLNVAFARYAGIDANRRRMQIMLFSGGVAGVAGALQVLSVHLKFLDGLSPGYGWTGIVVALLGRKHPFGVVLAALFFGTLNSGERIVDRATSTPSQIVGVITGVIVLLLTAEYLIAGPLQALRRSRRDSNREVA